jgi:nucleotide-binding universal stress UspA family protein
MTLRLILAPLLGGTADPATLDAGIALARRFEAHLAALFVRIDPRDAVPVIGEGVSPAIIDQLTRSAEAEITRQREQAEAVFETACARAAIARAETPTGGCAASAGWLELAGRRDEIVPRRARTSDLVVLARASGDEATDATAVLEATLMGGGRPLLLVPPGAPAVLGERLAIAWNGSTEAARAVAGALPFLERAGAIHVLTAPTWRTEPQVAGALIDYLAWRGIAASGRTVEAGAQPVAAALLQTAEDAGADLLVMGGYGRTRLSELVLGGVTRHVLAHATLPVLIAH